MTTTTLNTFTTIVHEDSLMARIKNILLFWLHHLFCPLKVTFIQLISVAVLPLTIYMLQLLGKFSSTAAIAAGILVILKVLIDLLTSSIHAHKTDQALNYTPPQCHYCNTIHCPFIQHPNLSLSLLSDTIACKHCFLNHLSTP